MAVPLVIDESGREVRMREPSGSPLTFRSISRLPAADMFGAFEGADRYGKKLKSWVPAYQAADMDILPEKPDMDARSTDLIRNDAYAQAGVSIHQDSIVGAKYRLNAKPNIKVLGLSEEWRREFQEEVEGLWNLYAESPDCWIDAGRRHTFTGLIRQGISAYIHTGEIFAVAEWLNHVGRPYHTAIQMVSSERVKNPGHIFQSKDRIRGGVHMNMYGAPIGYYIHRPMTSNFFMSGRTRDYQYVKKYSLGNRLQVLHLFQSTRIGQSRGVSMLVAALKETKIARNFRDITLQNLIVNAAFCATVESDLPKETIMERLASSDTFKKVQQFAQGYLNDVSNWQGDSDNLKIDGVRIPHLYPGTRLNLKPLGNPGGGVAIDFEQSLIKYLAAGFGISYEELSKDYTNTTYSSARAAGVETWKHMVAVKSQIADPMAKGIFKLWFEEAVNAGHLRTMNGRSIPNMYDRGGLMMDAYCACTWIGASRGQIDELKETQAAMLRIQTGISTMERESAAQGEDWETVLDQLEREVQAFEERGLMHPMRRDINIIEAQADADAEKEKRKENRDDPATGK